MSGDFQRHGISMGHVRQALGFFLLLLRRIILYPPEKYVTEPFSFLNHVQFNTYSVHTICMNMGAVMVMIV